MFFRVMCKQFYLSRLLHKLYDTVLSLSDKSYALFSLCVLSVIESIFFPIPPDLLIISISLSNKKKAFIAAILATIFSVVGGIISYYIGLYLFDSIGQKIIESLGYNESFKKFIEVYNNWGFGFVVFAGLTPFPYKVITLASGVVHMNIISFILASTLSRALRFFTISTLIYFFNTAAKRFIEKYLGLLTLVSFFLLVGIYFIFNWII